MSVLVIDRTVEDEGFAVASLTSETKRRTATKIEKKVNIHHVANTVSLIQILTPLKLAQLRSYSFTLVTPGAGTEQRERDAAVRNLRSLQHRIFPLLQICFFSSFSHYDNLRKKFPVLS